MGVPCSQDCRNRLNAEMDGNQLEPSWRWAFDNFEFTVPKAERGWFRCKNEGCDGSRNWKQLNLDNPPELSKCRSCGIQLQRLNTEEEEEEVQDNRQQSSQQLPVCDLCGAQEWNRDNPEEVVCDWCGFVNEEISEKYDFNDPAIGNTRRHDVIAESRKRDRFDLINANRLISGGNKTRLGEMKQLIGLAIDAWPNIVVEAYGQNNSNLPPRYCECRKAKQNQGRARMILHLHQILQRKGNFQSISNMLKIAGIHPTHFQRFINSGPVGNHLPDLKLSDGRHHLEDVVRLLIEPVNTLDANDLLLDEIGKEFDKLDDSNQFTLASNLESGLWSFGNNGPYARSNGYILMMIPYSIAITRAIQSIHGRRFGSFIRHLGEMAIADARFTGGGALPLENGWN